MFYTSLLVGVMSLAVLVLVVWRVVRRELHYRRLVRTGNIVTWEHLRFFSRLWTLLERRARPAPRNISPRQWVASAGQSLHLPEATLAELVELYYRLRWGRTAVEPERIRAAERQVEDLARMLK